MALICFHVECLNDVDIYIIIWGQWERELKIQHKQRNEVMVIFLGRKYTYILICFTFPGK